MCLLSFFVLPLQDIHQQVQPDEVQLVRRDYTANDGWETFLSYEDVKQVCQPDIGRDTTRVV